MSAMSAQRDRLLAASKSRSIAAPKKAQPMLSATNGIGLDVLITSKTGQIIEQGIGFPPNHFRCRTTTVAHFEPAEYHERVKEWAINGEVPHKQLPGLVGYAKNARWGTHKLTWNGIDRQTARHHYEKHKDDVKAASMSDYNSLAIELVRNGKSSQYLAMQDKMCAPYPVLYARDDDTGNVAVINIKGQNIATFLNMNDNKWSKLAEKQEIWLELPKGISKWIKSMLS